MEVVRASWSSETKNATRNLRVLLLVWWLARNRRVVGPRSSGAAQKQDEQKGNNRTTKNRWKIYENEAAIDAKSRKNRSWAGSGVQSRFGNASGRARDGFWTPK